MKTKGKETPVKPCEACRKGRTGTCTMWGTWKTCRPLRDWKRACRNAGGKE